MRRRALIAAAMTVPWLPVPGQAERASAAGGPDRGSTFPTRPVRLIVPFAPGGTTDIIARVVAERMPAVLGQPMLVENRAGGGGLFGALEISGASPDGYTIGVATVSTTASQPALNPRAPYDPLTDFTAIINMAATPNVIAVHPSFPSRDYKAFLAELRKRPGYYPFASPGNGSLGHMQMELYKTLSGTFIPHIAFRGAGPALSEVLAGQVPIIFDNLPSTLPYIQEGRLIAMVVAAPERLPMLPGVPTFKEVGLEPVNRMAYFGLHGPRRMPREAVGQLWSATRTVLGMVDVRRRIEATGSLIVASTPEQFEAQTRSEYLVYKKVVEQQKLRLD